MNRDECFRFYLIPETCLRSFASHSQSLHQVCLLRSVYEIRRSNFRISVSGISADDVTDWTTAVRQNDTQRIKQLLEHPIELLNRTAENSTKLAKAIADFYVDYAGFLVMNETQDRKEAFKLLTEFSAVYDKITPFRDVILAQIWLEKRISGDVTPVDADALVLIERAYEKAKGHGFSVGRLQNELMWQKWLLPAYIGVEGKETVWRVKNLAQNFLREIDYLFKSEHDVTSHKVIRGFLEQFLEQMSDKTPPPPEPSKPDVKEWREAIISKDKDKVKQLLQTPKSLVKKIATNGRIASELLATFYTDFENYLVYNETVDKEAAYSLIDKISADYGPYVSYEEYDALSVWIKDRDNEIATPVSPDGRVWFERFHQSVKAQSKDQLEMEEGIRAMGFLIYTLGRTDPEANRLARLCAVTLTALFGDRDCYSIIETGQSYLDKFLNYV